MQAEGSALRENEKYLDSIQGRIDLFTNAVQTMWMNAISSDAIKWFVDMGTAAINLVDTLGLIPTLIGGFLAGNAIKSVFETYDLKGLGQAIKEVAGGFGLLTKEGQKAAATHLAMSLHSKLLTSALVKTGYAAEANILAQKGLQIAELETMTTTELLGYAFHGLFLSIGKAIKAMATFLFTTPAGWATLIVGGLIAISALYDAFGPTHENFMEELDEQTEKLREVQNELKNVQSELKTTKDRIKELEDAADKGKLSFVDQKELDLLKLQNDELERQEKILQEKEKRERNKQIKAALNAFETDPTYREVELSDNNTYAVSQYAAAAAGGMDLYLEGQAYAPALQERPESGTPYENALRKLEEAYESLTDAKENLNNTAKDTDAWDAAYKAMQDAQAEVDKFNAVIDAFNSNFNTKYGEVEFTINPTTDDEKAFNDVIRKHYDNYYKQALINSKNGVGTTTESDVLGYVFGYMADDTAKEFNEKFKSAIESGLSPESAFDSVKAGYTGLFTEIEDKFGITADTVSAYFTQVGEVVKEEIAAQASIVKTYSVISDAVTKYQDILAQTQEIVADNTEVTQEYKDALLELVGDEGAVNECFDDSNKLLVKNADALKKLVSRTKDTQKANIKLAKAQAQLKYNELTKELRKSIIQSAAQASAYDIIAEATRENISLMEDQLETLERTIQQYSLLELGLTDAANAYDEYEKAKERDSQITYDVSFEEMLKTIDEGLLKNETGTEAFEFAVKAIVPEEFWKDIDDVDAKLKSIHDYIDGNPVFAKFFHVDRESGELDINADNVREFVNMGTQKNDSGVSVFDGESTSFTLSDDMKDIGDIAEFYGVTEAAVLAMFAALEKVDAKWGDILTQVMMSPIDRKIYAATKEIAEANEELAESQQKLADGEITIDEYNKIAEEYREKTSEANKDLDEYTQNARDRILGTGNNEETKNGVEDYERIKSEAAAAGYDGTRTQFGNIDTNDESRILEWTDEALETNKEALLSYDHMYRIGKKSLDDAWAEVINHYAGTYSSVDAMYDNFDGIELAFTPILQTDDGPVYIGDSTLKNYIWALIDKAKASGKQPTYDVLMELDQQGIEGFEQNGHQIKNILADVGETAQQTAEIMHYAGSTGAIEDAKNRANELLGYIRLSKQIAEAQAKVDKSTEKLAKAQAAYDRYKNNPNMTPKTLEGYEENVRNATEELEEHTRAWAELVQQRGEYPTEYEIGLVIADIDEELEAMGDSFNGVLNDYFEKDSSGQYQLKIDAEIDLEGLESKYPGIIEYVELLNTKTELQAFADTTSAEAEANALKDTVNNIIDAIEENLITLELDEAAINNVVAQINKILSGIGNQMSIKLDFTTPWGSNIDLGSLGFEVQSGDGAAGALGTARALGKGGLNADEHNAVVGELGPEMVVDPNRGIYYTVGENGTEMVDLPKGAIIYNHKQTEELLRNGYTSRGHYTGGLSFANGNAHAEEFGIPSHHPNTKDKTSFDNGTAIYEGWDDAASTLGDAADSISDAADEFREVFDWVEVRLEEIDETLSLLESQLENAIYYTNKNQIIDEMIGVNKTKLENLEAGYKEYEDYAAKLLAKIPADYQEAAKNGAIAIEEFVGEADEITLEAIQNYREWAQKAADLKQQANEVITAIRDLAIKKFDNAYEAGDVRATVEDSQTEKLQNQIDLLEEMGEIASAVYYGINGGDAESSTGMFENAYKKIEYLTEARDAMQKALDEAVEAGDIERGSNEWYELVNQMYEIDAQIHEATMEIEQFQNAINEIYWENFDQLISRIENLRGETQNLIDLMDSADMVITPETEDGWNAEDVQWTKEGLASLGLYAQQMEMAEYQARQYAEAIDKLTADYEAGLYSENEYLEKLNELKDSQYESIEAYYDAQEAIKDLNQARIDEIKKGIEKQIKNYEKLIDKQKEMLQTEKD